jgi:hypothetical protein
VKEKNLLQTFFHALRYLRTAVQEKERKFKSMREGETAKRFGERKGKRMCKKVGERVGRERERVGERERERLKEKGGRAGKLLKN